MSEKERKRRRNILSLLYINIFCTRVHNSFISFLHFFCLFRVTNYFFVHTLFARLFILFAIHFIFLNFHYLFDIFFIQHRYSLIFLFMFFPQPLPLPLSRNWLSAIFTLFKYFFHLLSLQFSHLTLYLSFFHKYIHRWLYALQQKKNLIFFFLWLSADDFETISIVPFSFAVYSNILFLPFYFFLFVFLFFQFHFRCVRYYHTIR